jgi:hypothetical protein
MEKVFSKTSAFPAYTTIMAVIDVFGGVIVPKFANITIIPGRSFAATNAELTSSLRTSTDHTEHIFGCLSVQNMVLCLVMAQSTGMPSIARRTLKLDISCVMAAAKNRGLLFHVDVPVFIRFWWIRRCICGSEIIRRELEGILLFWGCNI